MNPEEFFAAFPLQSKISWRVRSGKASRLRYGLVVGHTNRYGRPILLVQRYKDCGKQLMLTRLGVKFTDRPIVVKSIPKDHAKWRKTDALAFWAS